jgi:hypothetical protein
VTERSLQVVLALLGAINAGLGALALIAPDTFFDQIGKYGVENSHYVGDVGAFTTAAGIGVSISIWRPSWRAPLLWVGAAWFGLHALNHVFDVGEARSDARGVTDTLLLALGGVGSVYLALVAQRMQEDERPR